MAARVEARGARVVAFSRENGGVRLRAIDVGDFRRSAESLLATFMEENRDVHFAPKDVVLFRARLGNQLRFCYAPAEVEHDGVKRLVWRTVTLRLGNGTWDPAFLTHYAAKAGFQFEGLHRFERFYKEHGAKGADGTKAPARRAA